MSDIERTVARLKETFGYELDDFLHTRVEQVTKKCESPIEALLVSAMIIGMDLANAIYPKLPLTFDKVSEKGLSLIPQFPWEKYRIDIALFWDAKPVAFVECDGHQFHERTPEQAERDRSRDRAIQAAGILALRFTGREIHRSPFDCSISVFRSLPPMVGLRGLGGGE